MKIEKSSNFSGRALHQCKKAHCDKLAYQVCQLATMGFFYTDEGLYRKSLNFFMFIGILESFPLTFYYFVINLYLTVARLYFKCVTMQE